MCSISSIWSGIAIAGVNIGALIFGLATMQVIIGIVIIALFGVLQYAWIVPICLRFNKSGESETVKGMWIASGLTVLLSVGCWGTIMNRGFK